MHPTVIYLDYLFTSDACKTVTCLNFASCRDKYNRDNPFIRKSRPLGTAVVIVTQMSTYQKPVLDLEVLEPKSKKPNLTKLCCDLKLLLWLHKIISANVICYFIYHFSDTGGTPSWCDGFFRNTKGFGISGKPLQTRQIQQSVPDTRPSSRPLTSTPARFTNNCDCQHNQFRCQNCQFAGRFNRLHIGDGKS